MQDCAHLAHIIPCMIPLSAKGTRSVGATFDCRYCFCYVKNWKASDASLAHGMTAVWHGRNSYQRSSALAQFVIHRGLIISVIQAVFSAVFYYSAIALYQVGRLYMYVSLLRVLYQDACVCMCVCVFWGREGGLLLFWLLAVLCLCICLTDY